MVNVNDRILEVRANKYRDKFGISTSEAIDLYKILDEEKVLTNFRPLKDVSGMAYKNGEARFILVNSNQIRARQHFTIGHELYHLFVQDDFTFMMCNVGRFDKKEREEYNADVFSSYLLMPEAGILNLIPESELARGGKISLPTIVMLEQHFAVSRRALLVRLSKMNLIDYAAYEQYLTGIKRSAIELGYNIKLYEKDSDYNVIGDYGKISKKLFDEEKISESHYFNLMNDIGINIDQFEDNGEDES